MPKEIIWPIGPSIAYVTLTQGKHSLIDSSAIPLVVDFSWFADKNPLSGVFYGMRKGMRLHDQILGRIEGKTVDHRNGNTLDNRIVNLRHATHQEQMRNTKIKRNNKSGFKGVHLHKKSGLWHAKIMVSRKCISLGYFKQPELASERYRAASAEHFGEFCRIA